MSTTPGTIKCTLCGAFIEVEFTRLPFNVVALAPNVEPLREHYAECRELQGAPKALEPNRELVGRIDQLLNGTAPNGGRFFVATGGSRACTMCGMNGADCLALVSKPLTLEDGREAGKVMGCCGACANGNTHPAPGEAKGTCAQWAADQVVRP